MSIDEEHEPFEASLELEAWKTTIDVQKHFNDLAMRVRGLAITVLGGFLAAASYSSSETSQINAAGANVSPVGLILASAFLVWIAFYVMDRMWYHRLLKAAVKHGRKVENRLENRIYSISLTKTIDEGSPLGGLRAGARLSIFYMAVALVLFVGAITALQVSSLFYFAFLFVFIPVAVAEWRSGKRRG